MSLKSSEILESPYCSSTCCQTCFPSIVRPMNRLCEWILKIFFDSPKMNPSIFFSMYFSVSDEEDQLLSSIPRTLRENVSLVQHRSNSFFPWERFLVKSQQVLFFVVLLLPLIGMQNLSHPFVTHVLRAVIQEFLCRCCSNPSQTCQNRKSNPRVSIVSA